MGTHDSVLQKRKREGVVLMYSELNDRVSYFNHQH